MSKMKMPTAYTILLAIIVCVSIMTWIVPAGEYDMKLDNDTGRDVPIAGTYHSIESNPQGVSDVIVAPIKGFKDAIGVSLFVLIIGGFLGVTMKTGAVDASIAAVTENLKGKEKWMIPVLMILFGLGGTSFGMAEETIAFYPLMIPVFLVAGYDTITAVAVVMLGAGMGVLGSTVNPFATGIASGFAETSLGDGIFLRMLMLVIGEGLAIAYVMKYAEKIKKDPSKSLTYETQKEDYSHFVFHADGNEKSFPEYTKKRKVIMKLFVLTFIIMIIGVIPFSDMGITIIPTFGWWFEELATLFLVAAVIIGLVARLKEKELVDAFVNGAKDLLSVALIVGVSRGITVVMQAGHIDATLLNLGEGTLGQLSSGAFSVVTYLFYIPLSFLIPSTSGLATLSMPIMAPLGDFAGIGRSLVITAYQSASGIVNLITPTSAVVMGGLAIGRVPYNKWLKFVGKFLGIAMIFIMITLWIAAII